MIYSPKSRGSPSSQGPHPSGAVTSINSPATFSENAICFLLELPPPLAQVSPPSYSTSLAATLTRVMSYHGAEIPLPTVGAIYGQFIPIYSCLPRIWTLRSKLHVCLPGSDF